MRWSVIFVFFGCSFGGIYTVLGFKPHDARRVAAKNEVKMVNKRQMLNTITSPSAGMLPTRGDGDKCHIKEWHLPWGKQWCRRQLLPVSASVLRGEEVCDHPVACSIPPLVEVQKDVAEPYSAKNLQQEGKSFFPAQEPYMIVDDSLPPPYGVSGSLAQDQLEFTVMQFNMLADCYAREEIFNFAPKDLLRSKRRWQATIEEILRYGADVICLQELDRYDDLKVEMDRQGYDGVYKQKGGKRLDGVAIFYKRDRFMPLASKEIDFGPDLENGVGLGMLLRPIQPDQHRNGQPAAEEESAEHTKPFCVATTHLYWHPRREGVRLAQAKLFFKELRSFLGKGLEGAEVPMVITGDFNTRPGHPVYRLIRHGQVEVEVGRAAEGEKAAGAAPGGAAVLLQRATATHRQALGPLRSAYAAYGGLCGPQVAPAPGAGGEAGGGGTPPALVGGGGGSGPVLEPAARRVRWGTREADASGGAWGEPAFTSCTEVFASTLDYIWYGGGRAAAAAPYAGMGGGREEGQGSSGLVLTGLLELPGLSHATQDRGLPSESYPSDHLTLLARFRLNNAP